MKDVLVVAHFTQVPGENGNGRFDYLAKMLCEAGYCVELITSSFSHRTKTQRVITDEQKYSIPYKLTLLYEPGYPKNICLQRFFSHWLYGHSVKKYLKHRKRPDVIYCSVPSLDVAYQISKFAKKYKIRFIIDIQDLWPEAFLMVFHIPVIRNLVFAPFEWKANRIYTMADNIVAVSQTYADRALRVNEKCDKATVVFLGTELARFDELTRFKGIIEKAENEVWMAYIGTLGYSYDLTSVMDAMALLRKVGEPRNIRFIIMGQGSLKAEFESYAKQLNLLVTFTGMLPYSEMVSLLSQCDFAVNPILAGSAGSIINKVADYAAAGLPVINTQESEEYRDLLEQYVAGINCANGNIEQLSNAINTLCCSEESRIDFGAGNRRLAEEKFDRRKTYRHIVELITKNNIL